MTFAPGLQGEAYGLCRTTGHSSTLRKSAVANASRDQYPALVTSAGILYSASVDAILQTLSRSVQSVSSLTRKSVGALAARNLVNNL